MSGFSLSHPPTMLSSVMGLLENGLNDFLLPSSNNNELLGNTPNNNLGNGFLLISSSNNNLQKNTANKRSVYRFAFISSNNNTIAGTAPAAME
jgi:parallel beta-helix repeat protein